MESRLPGNGTPRPRPWAILCLTVSRLRWAGGVLGQVPLPAREIRWPRHCLAELPRAVEVAMAAAAAPLRSTALVAGGPRL